MSAPATDRRNNILPRRGSAPDCRGDHRGRRCVGLWPGKVVTEVTPAGPFWRQSQSTRIIWSTTQTGTPAISCCPGGSCPGGAKRARPSPDRGMPPGQGGGLRREKRPSPSEGAVPSSRPSGMVSRRRGQPDREVGREVGRPDLRINLNPSLWGTSSREHGLPSPKSERPSLVHSVKFCR